MSARHRYMFPPILPARIGAGKLRAKTEGNTREQTNDAKTATEEEGHNPLRRRGGKSLRRSD